MNAGRVVVLQSFGRPRATTNPYLVLLSRSVPQDEVVLLPFSWRTALTGRWDVFHVHWPDVLLRGGSRGRTRGRQLAALALLLRIRLQRKGLVRTVHNAAPHEGGDRLERATLRLFDRWTTQQIVLGPLTAPGLSAPATVVPHGHYRDWYRDLPVPSSVPGRLLFFGLVRPYKGVPQLIRSVGELDDPGVTLMVAGHVPSASLRAQIETEVTAVAQACGPGRVRVRLEHLDDAALAGEVGSAELVVLPYREMGNSGAALLALSLGRPVLVPSTATTEALASEVGPGWVLTYPGTLTAQRLHDALELVRSPRSNHAPDLSGREWADAGRQHAQVYRDSLSSKRH